MTTQEAEVELKEETVEGEKGEEPAEVTVEKEEAKKVSQEVVEEKEKAKPEKKTLKKKEEEEDIVEERIYTVPLSKAWISPRTRHSPRAVRILKGFIVKHMKVDSDSVKILNEVNEKIWERGIQKPPRKIRIRVTKDSEDIVTVRLPEGD